MNLSPVVMNIQIDPTGSRKNRSNEMIEVGTLNSPSKDAGKKKATVTDSSDSESNSSSEISDGAGEDEKDSSDNGEEEMAEYNKIKKDIAGGGDES